MFVITADQIGSRGREDLVGATRDHITEAFGSQLALAADRNAGDEIQMLTASASTALAIVLDLTRGGQWSVGLGCGTVRSPLPEATREASGPAFFAARDAVDAAKKQRTHFALRAESADTDRDSTVPSASKPAASEPDASELDAINVEAVLDLLLIIRDRRTDPGWELYDLLATGITQQDAAERLAISAPAVSSRAQAANIKAETAALPALTKLLDGLDARCGSAQHGSTQRPPEQSTSPTTGTDAHA